MGNSQANNNNNNNNDPNRLKTSDSYEEVHQKVNTAIEISSKFQDEQGYQLYFHLIPEKEEEILLPLFWKFSISVEVYLLNIITRRKKHKQSKVLNFNQFHKLYYFLLQMHALEESEHTPQKAKLFNDDLENGIFSDNSEKVEECIICMERMPNTVFSCAHAYCQICAKQWCKKSGECPMCRATIAEEDSFHIMDAGDSKAQITNLLKSFATPGSTHN